ALRGDPTKPGDFAPRRFLHVLAGESPRAFGPGSGRKDLAESIAAGDNPLFARVIVNRVWAWHFGRGLVGTPSNFGTLGERPTNPELLDYLATPLPQSAWPFKALHRLLMLSATYQQSSFISDCGLRIADSSANPKSEIRNPQSVDPENRFLWRMNRQRLDVEAWRDAMLAVSGRLDPAMSGPTFEL